MTRHHQASSNSTFGPPPLSPSQIKPAIPSNRNPANTSMKRHSTAKTRHAHQNGHKKPVATTTAVSNSIPADQDALSLNNPILVLLK